MRASRARTEEIGQQFEERLGWLVKPVMAIDKRRSAFLRAPKTVVVRLADQMGAAYAQQSQRSEKMVLHGISLLLVD